VITALVSGPPPRSARAQLVVLVLATAALAHVPGATAAALGPALVAALLAPLWLPTRGWVAVAVALGVATLPLPPMAVPALVASAVVLLGALGAGALVAQLAAQVQLAQSAVLRQTGAHEEAVRAAHARHQELATRLDYVSTHDRLTGLRDRAAFLHELDGQLATGVPTGVVVIALAGFAEVNETLGPDVGDEVLSALSRRLAHAARESDLVGRLGGDVFAVLLPGLSAEHAEPVGSRLHAVVDDPVTVGPHVVPLRSRAGIACSAPGELTSAELVRRAELTARNAPAGGPVCTWEADSTPVGASRLELEADLHRGLVADELFLLYQPLISTKTGTITSVEALVRWQHPERGMVPPDEFIGLAEATGLIVPLGLRVLEMACAQLKQWTATGSAPTVAVNVSARQLVEKDFVIRVREVLWSSGVDPHQVVLELTESLLVDDSEAAVAVLWQLRALGVRLAIDDFGTGYSSLARLGDMPVDELKIDKSFVDRLGAQPHDSTALVTAAVAMGHGLGLEVVAEGVETAMQAAFLSSVGCDLLQGYLLGRPQRADDVTPQLGKRLLAETATIPGPRAAAEAPAMAPELSDVVVPGVLPSLAPEASRHGSGPRR
jgi:diguanylate cyclase (GGDEF)-like protein